jgi:arylsulfatase A-like enzyme
MKRFFIFLSAIFGTVSIGSPHAFAASNREGKEVPNIVFFLVDDLGYADCGFNGGKDIRTPAIDRLAKEGTVLEGLYVQPVCSPTRAALMTGRYATRTGVYTIVRPHAKWGLPLRERTLADGLKQAGYETAIVGKWHLGEFDPAYLPTARGFEHQYGHYFGAIDYFTHERDSVHDWHRDDREVREEGYSTHLLAREACHLIEQRQKNKPLFLYIPFNGIHAPHQVPDSYTSSYGALSGVRRKIAGMLSAVDEAVGQITTALEQAGMRENTLIVFSSDNGGPPGTNNGPLRGWKGSLYEGGVRACGFVHWPGRIASGKRIREVMHAVDWYPTLLQLAGGGVPQGAVLDGRDVWPMLSEGAKSPHEAVLIAASSEVAAMRMGDWKLVPNPQSKGTRAAEDGKRGDLVRARARAGYALYDLSKDEGEANDLAATEPERLESMRARLHQLLEGAAAPGHEGLQPGR